MKTKFNKQDFAAYIFDMANNYIENYKYDLFYDIGKLHSAIDYRIAGICKYSYFYMFIRKSGFDLVLCNEFFDPKEEISSINYRIKNNDMVIKLTVFSGSYTEEEVIEIEKIKG